MDSAYSSSHDRKISEATQSAIDRRQFRRLAIALVGRFMRPNKHEHPCKLIDVSEGGAAFTTPVEVDMGERIVAYFDRIGGIEGNVVRTYSDGFAIELIATPYKREKLLAQIATLTSAPAPGNRNDLRRHQRHAIDNKTTSLKLDEGIVVQVRVIDISMSGASIETDARPAIGTEILLGKLRGRVVRHHIRGVGVEFTDIQNPEAVRRYFG